MTRSASLCLLLTAAVPCVVGCKSPSAAPTRQIQWVTNYGTGLELARQQGKPVLIDLYADWCGPCRKLDADTWSSPRVQELAASFVCIKVDVDEDRATARWYNPRGIPAIIFLRSDGSPIGSKIGFTDASRMEALMQEALQATARR